MSSEQTEKSNQGENQIPNDRLPASAVRKRKSSGPVSGEMGAEFQKMLQGDYMDGDSPKPDVSGNSESNIVTGDAFRREDCNGTLDSLQTQSTQLTQLTAYVLHSLNVSVINSGKNHWRSTVKRSLPFQSSKSASLFLSVAKFGTGLTGLSAGWESGAVAYRVLSKTLPGITSIYTKKTSRHGGSCNLRFEGDKPVQLWAYPFQRCRRIKKQRDLRLFIFFPLSKEQGNLSGNPKVAAHPFEFLRKYLALAGGSASPFLLTVVALQAKPLETLPILLPLVALWKSCPASLRCISRRSLSLWLARLPE